MPPSRTVTDLPDRLGIGRRAAQSGCSHAGVTRAAGGQWHSGWQQIQVELGTQASISQVEPPPLTRRLPAWQPIRERRFRSTDLQTSRRVGTILAPGGSCVRPVAPAPVAPPRPCSAPSPPPRGRMPTRMPPAHSARTAPVPEPWPVDPRQSIRVRPSPGPAPIQHLVSESCRWRSPSTPGPPAEPGP